MNRKYEDPPIAALATELTGLLIRASERNNDALRRAMIRHDSLAQVEHTKALLLCNTMLTALAEAWDEIDPPPWQRSSDKNPDATS